MTYQGQPEHPYGQPQLPQQPYGQRYAPQQPPYMPRPTPVVPRSQAVAVTALVLGVIAAVAALWVVSRGVAPFIGLAALILGIIALVSRRQGGKALAVIGLTAGMASIPLAVILWIVSANQQTDSVRQQRQMEQCIKDDPKNILSCSGLD